MTERQFLHSSPDRGGDLRRRTHAAPIQESSDKSVEPTPGERLIRAARQAVIQSASLGATSKKENRRPRASGGYEVLNMLQEVAESLPNGKAERVFDRERYVEARATVQRYINQSRLSPTPICVTLEVDPSIAQVFLSRNENNRKLSEKTVRKYARDMREGRWQSLNGQTIVISKDGDINDGQHRLTGIVEADVCFPFLVVFGADRDSRLTLDQNKVRTSGQYLQMQGVPDANNVAAVASILMAYDTNKLVRYTGDKYRVFGAERPTKAKLHEYAVTHMDAILNSLAKASQGDIQILAPKTRVAATHRIISRHAVGQERVEQFFTMLLHGVNLKQHDPALMARHRLMKDRQTRPPVLSTIETIVRTWNAFARGETLTRLALYGDLPKVRG